MTYASFVCVLEQLPCSATTVKQAYVCRPYILSLFALLAALWGTFNFFTIKARVDVAHGKILAFCWRFLGPLYLFAYLGCLSGWSSLSKCDELKDQTPRLIAFAMLTMAAPVYFIFETVWLIGEDRAKDNDYFKLTQELSSRAWAALQILLAFYWFHDLK